MTKISRALFVSAVATGTVAVAWRLFSTWRARAEQVGAARTNADLTGKRSRADEIEALTQEQKDLMLREFAGQI